MASTAVLVLVSVVLLRAFFFFATQVTPGCSGSFMFRKTYFHFFRSNRTITLLQITRRTCVTCWWTWANFARNSNLSHTSQARHAHLPMRKRIMKFSHTGNFVSSVAISFIFDQNPRHRRLSLGFQVISKK